MDPHMNIFQAYHGGNQNAPDKINRLEDNLTRGFIICLKYLKEAGLLKEEVLKRLLGFEVSPDNLTFDLQNLDDTKALRRLQKSSKQWLLLITRNKHDKHEFDWSKAEQVNDNCLRVAREDKKQLLKDLNRCFRTGESLQVGDFKVEANEISSYYDLLHECRPDAWIYEESKSANPHAILVESKVGSNQLTNAQIYRHITGKKGYNQKIKDFDPHKIKSTTWEDIVNVFDEIPSDETGICKEMIAQFKEYLMMSGEILNLENLNHNYDEEVAKNQFNLFLEKLDEKAPFDVERRKRRMNQLWDSYDPKECNASNDLHYSVFINSECIGCALTISNFKKGLMSKLLSSDELKSFLDEANKDTLERYKVEIGTYRNFDAKQGQIHGKRYDTFKFVFNLGELNLKNPCFSLGDVLDIAKKACSCSKQLDVILKFDWVDAGKPTPLRLKNLEAFKDPEIILAAFKNFMERFKGIILMATAPKGQQDK
jgi:hypothetical protein